MTNEPVAGKTGNLLQRSRFLEEMRRAGDDLERHLPGDERHGAAIQLYDNRIITPHDQQGGLANRSQRLAGEVMSTAAS